MDSKYLQEIQAIIQKDVIQSTYKLALLRAIIEIAQEFNEDKIIQNGMCIYPFSLLQRKLLMYYYPLFSHPSFIPQMHGESPIPHTGRQLIVRTSMSPIIQYYRSNGGFEGLTTDLKNHKIPDDIASEYHSLLETTRKTFLTQPMKYLGNSIRPERYSVVKYLARLPQNDTTSVISPADPDGYYTISQKYVQIFEDPSCAQQLHDSVIWRWIEYTLSLSDTLTREELYGLFIPRPHSGTDEIELQASPKPVKSLPLPAPISTGYETNFASQGNSASPDSMILALEETIQAEYALFSSLQQSIRDSRDAILRDELRLQKVDESIQRIGALYNVFTPDEASRAISQALSQYFAEQRIAQGAYSDMTSRVGRSRQKISTLMRERDRLQQMAQKAARGITVRKRQEELINRLHHEIALLDDGSGVQPRPFGYVDKPIIRFLTYCGDVTESILSQCIRLIPDPVETTRVKPALPVWFTEEFDTWWRIKQEMQGGSRESGSRKFSPNKPFFVFNERHGEIHLTIPSQILECKEGLDHISLIIQDNSQILHEEELPLYYAEGGVSTEEITVRIERPSQYYRVELSAPGASLAWMLDGFSNTDPLCFFDYESGRCVEQQRLPSKRFILLTRSKPAITPETAVLFTGRLFGDWYDYQYYVVDPVNDLSIGDFQAISGEDDRKFTPIDLHIDPECFDRHLRIDGRNVVLGSPLQFQISFKSEEVLSGTVLSIHPLGRDSTLEPIFHPLADLREGAEIDPDRRVCTVDLSHPGLLGEERVGAFTIRVRSEKCRTDIRLECVFLPNVSYRFSKPFFLPTEDGSPVQLEVTCPQSVHFEPEGPVKMETIGTGFLVTSNLVPRIQGRLRYSVGDDSVFEGMLSISVPHAAWRFEDEATGTIYPLKRSIPTIPDSDYLSLGVDPGLRVFLPESFGGTGTVSMLPQAQTVTRRLVNGQGYFSLARFNDTFRTTDAKFMRFEFTMGDQRGGDVKFPLFSLQRWYIHLLSSPHVSIDSSGNRIIEIEWEEYGSAQKRFLLLWRKKESGGASRVYVGEIPASARTFTIQGNHELPLSPGIYYLQFYRILNDWSRPPASPPEEKAPNVFLIRIEQNKDRALGESTFESGGNISGRPERPEVDPGIDRLICEIESDDLERRVQGINDFKEDYSIRRLNYHLLEYYPEQYDRLQTALFAVITDPGMPLEVRFASVELLGKNFSLEREHMLIEVLNDPDSARDLRIAILKVLSHGNTKECLSALSNSLNDPDPGVRGEAATSLGNTDSKDAIKPLIELLDDESVAVQRKAAAALGYIRSHDAFKRLVSIAFDKGRDLDLRITAIAALAKFH